MAQETSQNLRTTGSAESASAQGEQILNLATETGSKTHATSGDARLHEGEHPMFIFNRPLLAVLVALTVPVLLGLLDEVFDFSTF
jgi:hypothetical protein